jgi:FkbM family methyltransferase
MTPNALRNSFRLLKRTWRVVRGKDVFLAPQLECLALTLGNPDAAWTFCPEGLSASSIVYSFGVGEEISFDRELIQRFGVTIHAFDPTPRSIGWVQAQTLPDRFVFHPYGVAAQDGLRRFTPPRNRQHVSHTVLQRDSPWDAIEVPVQRLSTILRILDHTRIDLLKMDIEGAEYEVITDLVDSGIVVEQLLVEFHHRWAEVGVSKTKHAIRQLSDAGYRIFSVSSSGEEFGFLKGSDGPGAKDQESRTQAAAHESPRRSEYRPGR